MNNTKRKQLPPNLVVERAQTQKHANEILLTELINRFDQNSRMKVLDLPCGNLEFLSYMKVLFPQADLNGADIIQPKSDLDVRFYAMDLTKEFTPLGDEQYDLITSISGIMMFSNTLSFVDNCCRRIKPGGTFVITNDNNATMIDRLAYMFLGRFRMFKTIFEDDEPMTENVPIQEVVRLLRNHNIEIEKIEFTSLYLKDLKYLPFVLLVYPFQMIYLSIIKTKIPKDLIKMMYPFKHFFYKNYIVYGHKKQ